MDDNAEIPIETTRRLRAICLALPDVVEQPAWVGIRWSVRGRTFAHVLSIEAGWPPAYARAAATEGPTCVLMFRSAGPELDALRHGGPPFFAPPWRADEVGLQLGAETDWQEVEELLHESHRLRTRSRR